MSLSARQLNNNSQKSMRINNHINMLPSVSVSKQINNLDVNRCYVIAPNGVNIRISHAKYSDIRRNYTKAIEEGQLKKCVVLNEKLTNDGRFYLTHIDYVKGKYMMTICDCHLNERFTYDFEKDLVFYYTEKYANQIKAYQKKNNKNYKNTKVHGNKKHPNGYWKKYNKDYYNTKDDIQLKIAFRKKYNCNAFAKDIAEYERNQKSKVDITKNNSNVDTTKNNSKIQINPGVQQYIKRLVPIFRNITDESAFMDILQVFIKTGEIKSHIDSNEMEKMKKDFCEMKKEISKLNEVLSLFS